MFFKSEVRNRFCWSEGEYRFVLGFAAGTDDTTNSYCNCY